jgi:hypothetical protein
MDWDISPTQYAECATIQPNSCTIPLLAGATNHAFNHPNPLTPLNGTIDPFTDFGPYDHGACFDFDFGSLGAGESVVFNICYGAASTNKLAAGEALSKVAAKGVFVWNAQHWSNACSAKFPEATNGDCGFPCQKGEAKAKVTVIKVNAGIDGKVNALRNPVDGGCLWTCSYIPSVLTEHKWSCLFDVIVIGNPDFACGKNSNAPKHN